MRRRRFRHFILLLLLAAAVYLGIRLYPVWKAAVYLEEHLDMAHYAYELDLELDREALPEGSSRVLGILTELAGLEEGALYRLTVKGEVWEDIIHILVFPGSAQSPLMELYLSNDADVINETMLYNAVRNNLVEKYPILGPVIPQQQETMYMTLEQTEQLFGLNLKEVRDFRLKEMEDRIGAGGYFLLMAVMSREKAEERSRFTLTTDQAELQFEIPEEGGMSPMKIRLQVQNPSELTDKAADIASRMGFPAGQQLAMVKSFAVTMTPGGEQLAVPGNYVSQSVVELISRIREWIGKFMDSGGEEAADFI